MSPLELNVLLHHYCSPEKYKVNNDKMYSEICREYADKGMFAECAQQENGYLVTDLGKAWIHCILNTAIPTQRFVDANGAVIDL